MRKLGLALVFALLTSAQLQANVSLKNGNFFIGYTDVIFVGGYEPKVERVYNSKTSFKGIFGHGWGTEIEGQLIISADGSLLINEYGGGAENRFIPVGQKPEDIAKVITTLVTLAQSGGFNSPSYKDKLKSDIEFRNAEWERWVRAGKLKRVEIKVGTQFKSNKFSYQYITKTAQNYIRVFDNGKQEVYNLDGRLVKVQEKSGNFISLTYKNGLLEKLIDNQNRKMFFSFNAKKLVEKIELEGSGSSAYKYNPQDELISSKDMQGNAYTYAYSPDARHNLTEIGYSDGTKMLISYYGKDLYENVKSIKDKDGSSTDYQYVFKNGKFQFIVTVTLKDKKGKAYANQSYEYWIAINSTGEEYTQKLIQIIDGDKTETTYHAEFGLPLSIKRQDEESKFEYDQKGRITYKETGSDITRLAYDQTVGKISKVSRKSKGTGKELGWSTFAYDGKTGNLTSALNSQKQSVRLGYDRLGRIATMLDQDNRRIDFTYNAQSKPIEIKDAKKGSIKIKYGAKGEIQGVDSPLGPKVAMEVTTAFNNLLEIIRPAGVSLSL
ncbi:MAG: RHS repeat protein [Xanthomonadaceae bacterium]|nr:RHS repeat protein [Xanthomonadaceae bacterium]